MKTIAVTFQTAEGGFSIPITPGAMESYGFTPVSHINPFGELIELASREALVQLAFTSHNQRGNYLTKLKQDKVEEIHAEDPIQQVKLVVYERGWPDQMHRRIYIQSAFIGDTVLSGKYGLFHEGVVPFAQDKILILGPGICKTTTHYCYDDVLQVHRKGQVVVIKLKPWHRSQVIDGKLIIITSSDQAASHLLQTIDGRELHCLEVNGVVKTIIMAPEIERHRSLAIYGSAALPKDNLELLTNNGARIWDQEAQWGIPEKLPKAVEELIQQISAP